VDVPLEKKPKTAANYAKLAVIAEAFKDQLDSLRKRLG